MEVLYEKMAKHYVDFTGQKLKDVKKDMERDNFMTAQEAKDYGLIDEIQYNRE
jgi:ATP-dependent Clp protease protease subunit